MSQSEKQITIFFLTFLVLCSGIGTAYLLSLKKPQAISHYMSAQAQASVPVFNQLLPLASPSAVLTPTPVISPIPSTIPEPALSSQPSPDGTEKLVSTTQIHSDLTKTYTFSLQSTQNTSQQPIILFTKTVGNEENITIPFNTFSPDNSFVFLQDTVRNATAYIVLKTNGQPFANSQQYENVSQLFQQYTSIYTLYAVTGWASDTLLILETTQQNTPSTSFWFDVTSQGFTPLATQF